MLLASLESQTVGSDLTELELVHSEWVRVRCLDFTAFVTGLDLEEAILGMQWIAIFSMLRELLNVNDGSW